MLWNSVYVTDDPSERPSWRAIDLAALGMRGTLQDVVVDPYSPCYTDNGDEFRAWIVTDTERGLLTTTDDTCTYTVQYRYGWLHRLYLNVRQWLAL